VRDILLKNITLIFIIIFSIVLASCSFSNETFQNKEFKKEQKEIKNYGFEFSLLDDTSIDENQIIYKINDISSSFTPSIKIKNNFDKTYTYRVFFLLDYMQKEITYNDKKVNFIDINIKKNQSKELSMSIDIPKGINDLLVLCVRDPNNILDKEAYISSGNVYLARRAVIINDNDNINKKRETKFTSVNVNHQYNSQDSSATGPSIKLLSKEGKEYSLSRIPNNFTGNMQLEMGSRVTGTEFAIFSILGDEVIKVDHPFIKVNGAGDFKVNLLKLPISKELDKNLIIGVVENPFTLQQKELIQQKAEFVNIISLINAK